MKIEEVKSTIKTQRISAHTHVKGLLAYNFIIMSGVKLCILFYFNVA